MQQNYLGMVFAGLCWGFWKQQASGVNSTQRGQCPGTTKRVTQVPQDNTIQRTRRYICITSFSYCSLNVFIFNHCCSYCSLSSTGQGPEDLLSMFYHTDHSRKLLVNTHSLTLGSPNGPKEA